MTHSKQLGSKLISLLLAFAMILALMPAVSLTASAEADALYTLTSDKQQLGDGWTWNGKTLHFFGSGTYDCSKNYFYISSAKDNAAEINVSGSLTVNIPQDITSFVTSDCELDIRGAGVINLSYTGNGIATLFNVPDSPITYAGGAICSDDNAYIFYCSQLTMDKGSIDAPKSCFKVKERYDINNSSVSVAYFGSINNSCSVDINIEKSFVDVTTLCARTSSIVTSRYRLENSVLRSADSKDTLTAGHNGCKPYFYNIENSVVYLPNVDDMTNTPLNGDPTVGVSQSVGSGWVFCEQVLTNASYLEGGENSVPEVLSGAYVSASTNRQDLNLTNISMTGGILINCPYSSYANDNVSAENATIAILSTDGVSSSNVYMGNDSTRNTYKSCTIADIRSSQVYGEFCFGNSYAEKCNIYSNRIGRNSMLELPVNSAAPEQSQSNNLCVPKGCVNVMADLSDGNIYADITAGYVYRQGNSSAVFCGNVCSVKFYSQKPLKFDGSDQYDVSIGMIDYASYTVGVKNNACANYKNGTDAWTYYAYESNGERTWKENTALYIGKPVFNTLSDPSFIYGSVNVSKVMPIAIDVPLTCPYEDSVTLTEFKLTDGTSEISPSSVGIITEVTGSGNTLTLKITAEPDAVEGDYYFSLSVNGQNIIGQSEIGRGYNVGLVVSEYPSHTMEFGDDSSISWPYIDKYGNPQTFTGADYEKKIEADTWTWYGRSDWENGYGGSTLVLNDGFNFTTTADYGISKTKQTSFNIVVKGSCTVNAAVCAIYSGQNVLLNINGADDNSTLSVNRGIVSDEELYISGVDIEANNFDSVIDDSVLKPLLQSVGEIFLYDCKITANDNWELENIITGSLLKISRGVTLDFPASTIDVQNTCIGELESVDNIQDQGRWGALTVEDSPYGPNGVVENPKWIDSGKGMKLSTKPLECTGTASDLIIADDTLSADGDYCLFGGKIYRLDLSKLVNVDISGCTISKTVTPGYAVKSELVDGRQYLVVTPSNTAKDSTAKCTVTVTDSNDFYGSSMSLKLDITFGRVVPADKIKLYHEGSYGSYSDPTDCYTMSAAYNGKPLERQGTFLDLYYLVPSNKDIVFTLIPNDGFRFETIGYGDDTSTAILDPTQDGTYILSTDGADQTLTLMIAQTYSQQYCNVDISADLRQSVSDSDISVTLTYPNGKTKTLDGTNPAYVLSGTEVTVSMTSPSKSVLSINSVKPDYDSKTGVYSAKLSISKDTEITAQLENLADLCSYYHIVSNADDNLIVTPAPINSLGQYKIGTEIEIFASYTEDKFINDATFNGVEIEPYKQGNGGYYYKATTAAGRNRFVIWYTDLSTLNIKKPEHGSVEFSGRLDGGRSSEIKADGTQVYSIGTNDIVTLTITPDSGYQLKSVKLDGDKAPEVTVKNGACSFMMDQSVDWTFTAEFEKKSTGGNTSGGGHYSGGSGTVTKESKPSINGESKSWSDIASDITKNGKDGIITIDLNGETTLPEEVIKAIKDSGATVIVNVDSTKSWTIKGSDIKDGASSADLSLLTGTSSVKGARGSVGYRFSTGGNDVGADLTIQFKPEYAGKFANLYFIRDSKAEFTSTAKVAEDGSATFTGVTAKGEYVVMLSDFSDLPGDVNNDGKVLISDALAALYHYVEIEQAANSAMLDFNGDGENTLADALAILRYSVGLTY